MSYGVERLFLLSLCLACCCANSNIFENFAEWNELEFAFPNISVKNDAIQRRWYVPGKSVPMDVEFVYLVPVYRYFVTIPRLGEGRPMTLALASLDHRTLHAYPDYDWNNNQGNNCDGLTSVFRVAVDECDRLWVLDTGKIGEQQVCPPQLLAFDLANDGLVYRHRLNANVYNSDSLFVTPIVDTKRSMGSCDNTFVYLADAGASGVVVVDVNNNRSWRVNNRYFYPYPNRGYFNIDGEGFKLMRGVAGMTLSPPNFQNERYLYFHSLSSTKESIVSTSVLRNESFNYEANPYAIRELPNERISQSDAQAMDSNGILYFGVMNPPSIMCWNSATEFGPRNFHRIAMHPENLQFASGIKVTASSGEEQLWILTSSFQRAMTGTMNSNRVNYRVHAQNISWLLRNSPCRFGY